MRETFIATTTALLDEDPRTARSMVVHLGDFLRATLARASRAEATGLVR